MASLVQLETFKNIFYVKDLRERVLYTLALLAVFRLGSFVPVPGVDVTRLRHLMQTGGGFLGLVNLFTGGAFGRFAVFALGIMPYISASIILQLLTVIVPYLERLSKEGVREPKVAISPAFVNGAVTINTRLEELRNTVDARQAITGGQTTRARVTPEGTIQLPAIGSVPATGLTLPELKREIELRYAKIVEGIEITPALFERAPRYVFVLGEVRSPGSSRPLA